MTLLQCLEQADYHTLAIDDLQQCSFPQLLEAAQQLRFKHVAVKQQAIAISYTNLVQFCTEILAFDGWCSQLYLLPDNSVALPADVIQLSDIDAQPRQNSGTARLSEHAATQWFMATSGTTGTPKWIAHSFDSLTRAVKLKPQSHTLRWALCYQPTRFAGLQVVLQSLLSGGTLVDCSAGDAELRVKRMHDNNVNAVSATPSLWRQLLMTGQLNMLALKQITLGGEIADQAILDALSKQFPHARLLHIYASTEAGAGFAVADKTAGFPAKWLQTGHSSLRFKIDNKQHLWLKPPHQPDCKLADRLDNDGFLDTEDLVEVSEERVHFLGRASGVINVGGNKVHPEQVEHVLLQHPAVVQARVYAKNSSVLGQLVAADVQVETGIDSKALKLQLVQHCMRHLARYQVPTQLNFVKTLATNASGKLSRNIQDISQHE